MQLDFEVFTSIYKDASYVNISKLTDVFMALPNWSHSLPTWHEGRGFVCFWSVHACYLVTCPQLGLVYASKLALTAFQRMDVVGAWQFYRH